MDRALIRWSLGLVATIGLVAAALAAATVWLLMTDSVTVSTATSTGDIGPLVRAMGTLLYGALQDIFAYL